MRVGTVWPEWIGQLVAEQLVASGQDRVADLTIQDRARTEIDLAVHGVCEACHDGWMQRLDDNVRPFLRSMIIGDLTALPDKRRRLLARWAAKTAIMAEYADDSSVRTPPLACEHVRRVGTHPGTQVLVGTYHGTEQILTHERDLFSRVTNGKKHYLAQTSFVIGKAFIQVFADPWRTDPPEHADTDAPHVVPLLAGHARKIDWPPTIPVTDANYDRIRHGPVSDTAAAHLGRAVPD